MVQANTSQIQRRMYLFSYLLCHPDIILQLHTQSLVNTLLYLVFDTVLFIFDSKTSKNELHKW